MNEMKRKRTMTDPHDIVEQIDTVIRGHEESIELLKTLRSQVAKDRKFEWREGVNANGSPIQYRVPIRENSKDV